MSNQRRYHDKLENWRLRVVYILMLLVFGFFGLRLFSLQILEGKNYLAQANENRTSIVSSQTNRGIIYDRNGFVLARNIASYNVVIIPADLPLDIGATQQIYRELSALINIPVSNGAMTDERVKLFSPCQTDFGLTEIVIIGDTNAPYTPIRVKCNLDEQTAMKISAKSADWPGVSVEIEPIRDYPTGELTAEVIGFLGPIPASLDKEYRDKGFLPGRDKVGYAGVESTLQDTLAGKNGERTVEVDVAGMIIRDLQPPVNPVPGLNVKLTIDTRLQTAAKAALVGEIDWWNRYFNVIRSSNGVVVAMNPKTGEVLALVSYPTFENNRMARQIPAYYYEQLSRDPNRPLFNHAISAEHPPGSVYKLAAAIGSMNEEVIPPTKSLICPGRIQILEKFSPNDPGNPRDYVCYNPLGHGQSDYLRAIEQSCDIYFYKISGGYQDEVPNGLGIVRMADYAKALGYGEITGIELPGEATGLVPDPTWKRINLSENWSTGDTYIAAMGQGFVLATPIQVMVSAAIVANDGKYMQPTLVKDILDTDGNIIQSFKPVQKWDITKDPLINIYDDNLQPTGQKKVVEQWVIDLTKEGMRRVNTQGTAERTFLGTTYTSAGKTGTAEYCDNVAQSKNLCQPGNWPTHSWYVAYAPVEDPEIVVVAFVYNGGEGASVAGPIVRNVLDSYFQLNAIDQAQAGTQ
jgi:penicillin-binding protein 2